MTKESGIGATLTVDDSAGAGQALTTDAFNVSVSTTRNLQDVSNLGSTTVERLALLADGTVQISGGFDDGTNLAHAVFKNIATNTNTRTVAFAHSGQTLTEEVLFTDYAMSRAQDGSITFSAPGSLAAATAFGWS